MVTCGVAVLGLLAVVAGFVPAAGSAEASESPSPTLDYAFANQLGSGIYEVDGRLVQIYRISPSVRLRRGNGQEWGLRLRLPATIGFTDFRAGDVLDTGLPENLAAVSAVPTVCAEIPAGASWWLGPFAGLGLGKDLTGGELSVIYAVGLESLTRLPWRENTVRILSRLFYSSFTTDRLEFVGDYAALAAGLDLRRGLGFAVAGHGIDGGLFGGGSVHFVDPRIVSAAQVPVRMRTQFEAGFTVGPAEPWKVLGIRIPRLGLSYRFGRGTEAVRVILGRPFPMVLVEPGT